MNGETLTTLSVVSWVLAAVLMPTHAVGNLLGWWPIDGLLWWGTFVFLVLDGLFGLLLWGENRGGAT